MCQLSVFCIKVFEVVTDSTYSNLLGYVYTPYVTGAEEAHFKWSGHSMTNLKWSGHLAKMVVLLSMRSRRLLKSGQAIA